MNADSGFVDVDGRGPCLGMMSRQAFEALLQDPEFPMHTRIVALWPAFMRLPGRPGFESWPMREMARLTAERCFCYDRLDLATLRLRP